MSLVSAETERAPREWAAADISWVEQADSATLAQFILRGAGRAVAEAYNRRTDQVLERLSASQSEALSQPGIAADIQGGVYHARHDHYQKGRVLVRSISRPVSVSRHRRTDHRVLYRAVSTLVPVAEIPVLHELDDRPEDLIFGEAHYFIRDRRLHQDAGLPISPFEPLDTSDKDDLARLARTIRLGAEISPHFARGTFGNIRKIG